jgi:hypothetical protein
MEQPEYLSLPAQQPFHISKEEEIFRLECQGPPPKVLARFYIDAVRDDAASLENGYPVYLEKVFVLLQASGDTSSTTLHVTDEEKLRFPQEWELFVQNSKKKRIPLEALPQMRPNIRKALNELGIRYLDDLVEKDVPEFFQPWKTWAGYIKNVHNIAEGKPKQHLKLVNVA